MEVMVAVATPPIHPSRKGVHYGPKWGHYGGLVSWLRTPIMYTYGILTDLRRALWIAHLGGLG